MIPSYVTPEYLSRLTLRHGLGTGRPGDRCSTQEVRAWLDLDPSTDACPPCADPLIWSLVIQVQDRRDEWRAAMPPLLPKLAGSKGSDTLSLRRLYRCADWNIRELIPAIMETWPEMKEAARALEMREPIIVYREREMSVREKWQEAVRRQNLRHSKTGIGLDF